LCVLLVLALDLALEVLDRAINIAVGPLRFGTAVLLLFKLVLELGNC
jgi:hypothetical protein